MLVLVNTLCLCFDGNQCYPFEFLTPTLFFAVVGLFVCLFVCLCRPDKCTAAAPDHCSDVQNISVFEGSEYGCVV